eukprot:1158602-Pelagomonas_calceolata.AAC.12
MLQKSEKSNPVHEWREMFKMKVQKEFRVGAAVYLACPNPVSGPIEIEGGGRACMSLRMSGQSKSPPCGSSSGIRLDRLEGRCAQ